MHLSIRHLSHLPPFWPLETPDHPHLLCILEARNLLAANQPVRSSYFSISFSSVDVPTSIRFQATRIPLHVFDSHVPSRHAITRWSCLCFHCSGVELRERISHEKQAKCTSATLRLVKASCEVPTLLKCMSASAEMLRCRFPCNVMYLLFQVYTGFQIKSISSADSGAPAQWKNAFAWSRLLDGAFAGGRHRLH